MCMTTGALWRIGAVIFVVSALPLVAHARPAESKRMERAKDLIADEQWVRAIDDLKAAADDPKEPNKAEALFWLAHSQNQARDTAAAVDTIRRLERQFPTSPWVKPAQSLRIEIAQRLQRKDFLWYTAVPPTPPAPAMAPAVPPAPTAVTPRPRRAALEANASARCAGGAAVGQLHTGARGVAGVSGHARVGARRVFPRHGLAHSDTGQIDAHGCRQGHPDSEINRAREHGRGGRAASVARARAI
jgi:hypothetical protein